MFKIKYFSSTFLAQCQFTKKQFNSNRTYLNQKLTRTCQRFLLWYKWSYVEHYQNKTEQNGTCVYFDKKA